MSEQETAPTEGAEETTNNEQSNEFTPIASQEELDRIIAKRIARVKATPPADYEQLRAAAAELEQIKEAQKSEDQKRSERIEQLERELNTYKQREQVSAWAAEIVKGSTIPASALRGSTREELEEHFEVLKGLITAAPQPKPKATPPGKSPEERDKPINAASALRQLRKG